jgi:peptidoglycan/LPS O-acetylase OafA/YrhL
MRMNYRPEIDGLRAVAVLSVVAFHAGVPGIPGGFLGVDIFFVISGYLITDLLLAELEATGRISLGNFFARRVRRLLPALLLVTVVTLLLALLLIFPQELPRLGKSATAMLFLAANVHFHHYAGGYFDPSTDVMPLLHTWSLSVEEQYYLVWPVVLIVIGHFSRRIPTLSTTAGAALVLALVAAVSFPGFVVNSQTHQSAAFYLVHFRAWEFAIGGLAMIAGRYWIPPRSAAWIMQLAGAIAIVAALTSFGENPRFSGYAYALPVAGSALMLLGMSGSSGSPLQTVFASGPMVRVGLISYSLYLWHWPLLALTRSYYLGQREPLRDGVVIALAFVLAAATYRWMERPIRYNKPGWFARTRTTLLAGALFSFLVLLLSQGVIHWGKSAGAALSSEAPHARNVACRTDSKTLSSRAACIVGHGAQPPAILVWGDSHADHLRVAMENLAGDPAPRTLFRTLASCPPLEGATPLIKGEFQPDCLEFNQAVTGELDETRRQGVHGVVLAARWNTYLSLPVTDPGGVTSYGLDTSPRDPTLPPQETSEAARVFEAGLRRRLAALDRARFKVLLVAPMPEMYFNVPQCLYRRSAQECVVPLARVDARRRITMEIFRRMVTEFPQVRLVDPLPEFCDTRYCYPAASGVMHYSDDNHISTAMALHLGKQWESDLRWLSESNDAPMRNTDNRQ